MRQTADLGEGEKLSSVRGVKAAEREGWFPVWSICQREEVMSGLSCDSQTPEFHLEDGDKAPREKEREKETTRSTFPEALKETRASQASVGATVTKCNWTHNSWDFLG
ncbi:Hypothetical predicted protein [Xyrichtys novacula]|uniref:Prolactin receptor n=1 Tax=Xyrichtys novacula TaxID=13765 RepID=A0AAV1GZF4_XYRNO|nr:Hypothetical predicted protein [Xyrichtys novacula]